MDNIDKDISLYELMQSLILAFKPIFLFTSVALLVTYLYISSFPTKKAVSIDVDENNFLKFQLGKTDYEQLVDLGLSPDLIFTDFKGNFLFYQIFTEALKNTDTSSLSDAATKDLSEINKLYQNLKIKKDKFEIELEDQELGINLLIEIIKLSLDESFKKIMNIIDYNIIGLKEQIELNREIHVYNLKGEKQRIQHYLNLEIAQIETKTINQIDQLNNALSVAIEMEYFDPVIKFIENNLTVNDVMLSNVDSSQDKIEMENSDNQNKIYQSVYSNQHKYQIPLYLFGSKLIKQELIILKEKIKTQNFKSSLTMTLSNSLQFIDSKNIDSFILSFEEDNKNLEKLLRLKSMIGSNLEFKNKLIKFNIDQIKVNNVSITRGFSYEISIIFGVLFGYLYSLYRTEYLRRKILKNYKT